MRSKKTLIYFRAIHFTVDSLIPSFGLLNFIILFFGKFPHRWLHCHANDVVVHGISRIEEACLFLYQELFGGVLGTPPEK